MEGNLTNVDWDSKLSDSENQDNAKRPQPAKKIKVGHKTRLVLLGPGPRLGMPPHTRARGRGGGVPAGSGRGKAKPGQRGRGGGRGQPVGPGRGGGPKPSHGGGGIEEEDDEGDDEDEGDGEEEDEEDQGKFADGDDDSDSAPSTHSVDIPLNPTPLLSGPKLSEGPFSGRKRFHLKWGTNDILFVVVHGEHEPHDSQLGHYIAPYHETMDNLCVPYPLPQKPKEPLDPSHNLILAGVPGWMSGKEYDKQRDFYLYDELFDDNVNLLHSMQNNSGTQAFLEKIGNKKRLDSRSRHLPAWETPRCGLYMAITAEQFKTLSTKPDLISVDTDCRKIYPPDPAYCTIFKHYIRPFNTREDDRDPPEYFDVGRDYLEDKVAQGERLDFEFATKIQGLAGIPLDAVWTCLNPDFVPTDRTLLLDQYIKEYSHNFLKLAKWQEGREPHEVSLELIKHHKEFCTAWVQKHYRNLSPLVTSAANAVISDIYHDMAIRIHHLPAPYLIRWLSRHPLFSQEFAMVVHAYMADMDQIRGNRNPSYKQMTRVSSGKIMAFRRFAGYMSSHATQWSNEITKLLLEKRWEIPLNCLFHEHTIDWYTIAGQLPDTHASFPRHDAGLSSRGSKKSDSRMPWERGAT